MSRIETINRQRIDWRCTDFGVTYEEVARAIGMGYELFKTVMEGKRGLTPNQLRKLTKFFG